MINNCPNFLSQVTSEVFKNYLKSLLKILMKYSELVTSVFRVPQNDLVIVIKSLIDMFNSTMDAFAAN